MSSSTLMEYTLSAEEFSMALSLINRPDLGKAVLNEVFGELSSTAIEERLKAASHSLLARGYARIGTNGIAMLSDDLQKALTPIVAFKGMIQVVVNGTATIIMNAHLGTHGDATSHWVEQGVVHRILYGSQEHLVDMVSRIVSIPQTIPARLAALIQSGNSKILMETFAELTGMDAEKITKVLLNEGWDSALSEALRDDLIQPLVRGSVCYLDVDAVNIEKQNPEMAVTGLYYLVGKSGWILTFSKTEKEPIGLLIPGTRANFEKQFKELQRKKSEAFIR